MMRKGLLLPLLPVFVQALGFQVDGQNPLHSFAGQSCDCTGVPQNNNSGLFVCNNTFLGPVILPKVFPLISMVSDYNRLGDLKPKEYLDKWLDGNNRWKYPIQDGYLLNRRKCPVVIEQITLPKGTFVDRFGREENGWFISAADTPYVQRALPPNNLITYDGKYPNNYHLYQVNVDNFTVEGGPAAPAFEQPGMGFQYDTHPLGDIATLVKKEYLKVVQPHKVTPGPGSDCSE